VRECLAAVEREVHGHALLPQAAGDRIGQTLVILDYEHAHVHSMPRGGHSGVTTTVTGASPGAAYNIAMKPHRLLKHPLLAVMPVAALTMLVAGCGGSKQPPLKTSASSGSGDGVKAAYRFSACMRAHGVTAFHDPHVSTKGNQVQVAIRVGPAITDSPHFKSAQKACAHLLPEGGNGPTPAQQRARSQAILAFARCMRRHGFPKFPDPTAQGQLTLAMIRQAGIDLQQPAVRPAAYACAPVTHGLLTRANINQALANPSGSG
jgi:hypothetical protein